VRKATQSYLLTKIRFRIRKHTTLMIRVLGLMGASIKYGAILGLIDPTRRAIGKKDVPDSPTRVRQFFETIGGSFLKLGQIMALQPDLVPPKYCDALFDLMDRIPPFDRPTANQIFKEETGLELEEVFEDFPAKPIATASIGQVYRATLDDEVVAVKIQRPEAETNLNCDIQIASLLIAFISKFSVKTLYWLVEPISEFIHWSREELDFRHEGRYTQKAYENAQGELFEHVPRVYWKFTSRRTLVIEFLNGITVSEFLRRRDSGDASTEELAPPGYNGTQYCTHIVENFLGGAFNCGLFHADLHPGNLMILPNNVVGYIDFGITGILSNYSRTNLVALTLAYAQGNVDEMLKTFVRLSTVTGSSNLKTLEDGLKRRSLLWFGDRGGEPVGITEMMLDWLALSKQSEVWPQRDVIKYIRCSVVMDGLVKRVDPNFDVGAALALTASKHLETGLRRKLFSYERLFEAASHSSQFAMGGPGSLRTALDNLTQAINPSTS